MPLLDLDHVNIQTGRLSQMIAFYCDVLGLRTGRRPPFSFEGAWLYCGDRPVIHLVEHLAEIASRTSDPSHAGGLSHFALRATGLAAVMTRLRAAAIPYRLETVPGFGTRQVHLRDPDGNHLHLDFPPNEAEAETEAGRPTTPA